MPEIITTTSIGVGYAVGGSSPVEPPPITVYRPPLSGFVVDTLGLPVPNACVVVFGSGIVSVATNAIGYYQFDQMQGRTPFGNWLVVAQDCDQGNNGPFVDFGYTMWDQPVLHNITMYRKPAILGATYDENGKALGVVCIVNTEPSTQATISVLLTRPDGTFGPFESMQAGTYKLEVRPNCAAPAYPEQTPDHNTWHITEGTGGNVGLQVVTNGG